MGEIIDFEEYLTAKKFGVPVTELRAHREAAQKLIDEMVNDDIDDEYLQAIDNLPEGYSYILKEDFDKYDSCDHTKWIVVEEDYQAVCRTCKLSAWSAPW